MNSKFITSCHAFKVSILTFFTSFRRLPEPHLPLCPTHEQGAASDSPLEQTTNFGVEHAKELYNEATRSRRPRSVRR